MDKSDIGLIGLGVMGSNLARNIADKKFNITVYNRTTEKTDEFIKEYGNDFIRHSKTLEEFIGQLAKPRKIIIMVKAGKPVDAVIDQLKPLLEKDDIVIDCGNSNFHKTKRRFDDLQKSKIHFVGCGVSGGEEGALRGPSLMPGGTQHAWNQIKEIFKAIAARDFSNGPCVTYIGDNAAGHYVKMAHNGIEYGVMQIMAEVYDILRNIYGLNPLKIAEIFKKYNGGKLKSYLFEISVHVLMQKDEYNEGFLINNILDRAAQKGTGKWIAIDSLERGIAIPTITEAVHARVLSSDKKLRERLSKKYPQKEIKAETQIDTFTNLLEDALYAAMLSVYAQGFACIQYAANEENWKIDLAEIARIWEGGCIIRADLLKVLHKAFLKSPKDSHLFEMPEIAEDFKKSIQPLRTVVSYSALKGIPVLGLASALSYFESLIREKLPANFVQGLRDYFGAHTYKRTDREGSFHTDWNK